MAPTSRLCQGLGSSCSAGDSEPIIEHLQRVRHFQCAERISTIFRIAAARKSGQVRRGHSVRMRAGGPPIRRRAMTERGAAAIASLHPISRRISPRVGSSYCSALHQFAPVHASGTISATRTLCATCPDCTATPHTSLYDQTNRCPATTSLESAPAQIPHLGPQDGYTKLVWRWRQPQAHQPPQ